MEIEYIVTDGYGGLEMENQVGSGRELGNEGEIKDYLRASMET